MKHIKNNYHQNSKVTRDLRGHIAMIIKVKNVTSEKPTTLHTRKYTVEVRMSTIMPSEMNHN